MVTSVAFAAAAAYAQVRQIKVDNAKAAPTFKGDDLYRQFCAVCHGPDGKGSGPAASALRTKATDLTQLARQNNSKFPLLHVKNILTGVDAVAAHGNIDMPTWGDTFKSISANGTFGEMRADAVVEYLKTIQR
jgi:mono/diheme cytochrome c family protein